MMHNQDLATTATTELAQTHRSLSRAAQSAAFGFRDFLLNNFTKLDTQAAGNLETLIRDLNDFCNILSTSDVNKQLGILNKVYHQEIDDLENGCLAEHIALNKALRNLTNTLIVSGGHAENYDYSSHNIQQTLYALFVAYLIHTDEDPEGESHHLILTRPDFHIRTNLFGHYQNKNWFTPGAFAAQEDNVPNIATLPALILVWMQYSDHFVQRRSTNPSSDDTAYAFLSTFKLLGDRPQEALTTRDISLPLNQRVPLALLSFFCKKDLDYLAKTISALQSISCGDEENDRQRIQLFELLSCCLSEEYLEGLTEQPEARTYSKTSSTNRFIATFLSLVGQAHHEDSNLVNRINRSLVYLIASLLIISVANNIFVIFLACDLPSTTLAIYFSVMTLCSLITQYVIFKLIMRTLSPSKKTTHRPATSADEFFDANESPPPTPLSQRRSPSDSAPHLDSQA